MKTVTKQPATCVTTLKLLGDYWTLRIIDTLDEHGELRYCELQRTVDNLNPVTLGNRLQRLEDAGLVSRCESPNNNTVTYKLTDAGLDATAVIAALNRFAAKRQQATTV